MEFTNIVLWGTGIIGHRYYNILNKMGITPVMFIDNNNEKHGTYIHGIKVCAPVTLKENNNYTILIACKASDEIYAQAVALGVTSSNIYKMEETLGMLILHAIKTDIYNISEKYDNEINRKSIIFDMQNGAALGGVETWVLEQGEKLNEKGYSVACLLGNEYNTQLEMPTSFELIYANKTDDLCDQIEKNIENLILYHGGIVVSNFAGYNMFSNCYYKRINKDVRHIMVIHSDDDIYYQMVMILGAYIDYCIVVSEKIKKKLMNFGFDKRKIRVINWNVEVDESYRKMNFNNIIRIGYAGRVTTLAKRLDYIPEIVEQLNRNGVKYIFQIAGVGDYYDELSDYIKKNDLNDKVVLLGIVDKSKIKDFWREQDIYFSCSDWEGHSISQCEGIAYGAVPVVTDVSGASDDICDGVNGYIVPVGDWKALADKICYLSEHRDILKQMSDAGMDRMRERNKLYKNNVLEELCH